ncbi:MAG TPA: LysR family transcriptional regulator [Candidatus Eisenbacteria bacterium]|nr:LysR family transcriptional regulator [Candidatus Eisenbacteria bacterium]
MTFHQLYIFDTVARYLNVSRAAQEVRISQPSLSRQLRLLEEECGLKLHRAIVGRGIKLTEEGREFWAAIKPILDQFDRVQKKFLSNSTASTTLLVGATQGPSVSFVPDALKAFKKKHPCVKPTLRTGDSRRVEEMLLKSEIDVAVVVYPSYNSRLTVEPLHRVRVSAVVSHRHPLAKKRNLTSEQILKAPFIVKMASKITELLEKSEINLNIAMRCESIEGVRAAVESGIGIGLLYRENVEHGLRGGYLKELQIPWLNKLNFQWFVLYRKGEPLSNNAQQFVSLIKARGTRPNAAARSTPSRGGPHSQSIYQGE